MNYFSVTRDVAVRSGVIAQRYRTVDGRFILNEDDMRHIRLLPEEYITGLDAIVLTASEANDLIIAGGWKLGEQVVDTTDAGNESDVESSEPSAEEAVPTESNDNSGVDGDSVDEDDSGSTEGDSNDYPSDSQDNNDEP